METVPDPYEATLQHAAIIARKIDKLMAAQVNAERQVLHRIACDYAAGKLTTEQLVELYGRYRRLTRVVGPEGKEVHIHTRPTAAALWNEVMPVDNAVMVQKLKAIDFDRRYDQNGDGHWYGVAYLDTNDPRPRDGQAVVYVLYDEHNNPCYVGSTEKFKNRINTHWRDKAKPFARWAAYPCADREAAYQLEDRLLKQYKPYLNRKASR